MNCNPEFTTQDTDTLAKAWSTLLGKSKTRKNMRE
jgi:hypothetical protein